MKRTQSGLELYIYKLQKSLHYAEFVYNYYKERGDNNEDKICEALNEVNRLKLKISVKQDLLDKMSDNFVSRDVIIDHDAYDKLRDYLDYENSRKELLKVEY